MITDDDCGVKENKEILKKEACFYMKSISRLDWGLQNANNALLWWFYICEWIIAITAFPLPDIDGDV